MFFSALGDYARLVITLHVSTLVSSYTLSSFYKLTIVFAI